MALTTQLWTINALATELGISSRVLGKRLSDLKPDAEEQQAGRVVRRWRLARVLRHLETAGGGNGAAQKPALPRSQYEAARALREEYTARLRKLEYQRVSGELISAGEVLAAWQQLVAAFRSRMLYLPSKLAPQLEMRESRYIQTILTAAVREALEELSQFRLPRRRARGNGSAKRVIDRPGGPRRPRTAPVH
ncbi:MAG: hypothetical protein ACREXX_05115 [Gammaproteobacteria bacterium]